LPRRYSVAVRFLPGCRGRVTAAELRRTARAVLSAEVVASGTGVEIVLADADTVRNLNRLYRGSDERTDVLSFASHEGETFIESPEAPLSLGEVVVCLPVAEAEAVQEGRTLAGEIAHLLVHGLLHILGYDHEETAESEAMKKREDEILAALGYAGQYAHGH
jgi:probable rRNA maturation factor